MVVLPTPGPPVMTSALLVSASRIASRWLSARVRPLRSSTQATAFSASIDRPRKLAAGDCDQPLGDGLLGAIETGKKHAVHFTDPVGDHGAFGHLERLLAERSG